MCFGILELLYQLVEISNPHSIVGRANLSASGVITSSGSISLGGYRFQ